MPLLIILLLIWTYTLTLGLHLDMDPVADLGVDFRHVLYHQRLRHCDCYVQTRKRRFQSGQINITFGPRDGDDCVESYDYGAREDERDCSTVGRSGYPAFDVLILTCCNIFMDIHLTHHITPPSHYNPRSPNQYPLNTPYQHTFSTHSFTPYLHRNSPAHRHLRPTACWCTLRTAMLGGLSWRRYSANASSQTRH